jgi:4-amino-4-deoxy-L-arabinose transferase-like glycosyltransferase
MTTRLSHSHYPYLALALLTTLSLAVRLYGLTAYGLRFDEAYHVQLVRLPSVGEMLEAVLSNPPSDPLYVLILRPWASLFGTEDGAIRALSVILSTAAVPVAFTLGRVLGGPRLGTASGLLGALLLALSPYAVEVGQEAALYVLASLTTTAALTLGLRWRAHGRGGWAYAALGVVAIYSHYVVAAILALFWLMAPLFEGRRPERAWTLAHLSILLAWAPWLVLLAQNWLLSPAPRAARQVTVTVADIGSALVQYTTGTASLFGGGSLLQWGGVALALALVSAAWQAGRSPAHRHLRTVIAASALIFLLPAALSAITGYWLFIPHFMIFLLPALYTTCATGACIVARSAAISNRFGSMKDRALLLSLTAWVILMAVGLGLFYRNPPHGNDGLRELAALIQSNRREGDVVVVSPPALQPLFAQYLPGNISGIPENLSLKRLYLPYGPDEWIGRARLRLDELSRGASRLWLLHAPLPDEDGSLLPDALDNVSKKESWRFPIATLYLFSFP